MKEEKHTPGPWEVGTAGPNGCPTVGYRGLMVAMVAHGQCHPTQANARLIAAAPELLAELQALHAVLQSAWDRNELPDSVVSGEQVRRYRSVIAKATGSAA